MKLLSLHINRLFRIVFSEEVECHNSVYVNDNTSHYQCHQKLRGGEEERCGGGEDMWEGEVGRRRGGEVVTIVTQNKKSVI